MDAVAVFGRGALPLIRPPPTTTVCCLTPTRTATLSRHRRRHDHLSAFPSNSNLFPQLSIRSRAASTNNESFIFLPHLVASLVCSLSFLFFVRFNWFSIDLFWRLIDFVHWGAGTSRPDLHYGETWRCSTWPCEFPLICYFVAFSLWLLSIFAIQSSSMFIVRFLCY